jgi:hypothetical protein
MAAAEKIMACKIHSHIFQRFYLPDFPATARDEITNVLDQLYRISPRSEAICRVQLLSAYDPEEHHITSIVQSAVGEVLSILKPLLFTPESYHNFQSELEKLFREGVELWRPVQRNEKRGTVDNKPELDWGYFEDYGPENALPAELEFFNLDPIMSLFPRVYTEDHFICRGFALWSSQSMIVAARTEYSLKTRNAMHAQAGGSPRMGGFPRPGNGRRESNASASSAGAGRKDDVPVSPKTSSGGQSSQAHVNGWQKH